MQGLKSRSRRHYTWEDKWAPYRGKYPDPTGFEINFIAEFLDTYPFERDDYVEDDRFRAVQDLAGIPNLRKALVEHLHQIRESKGYDVEQCIDFFSPFIPSQSKVGKRDYENKAMEAACTAMAGINAHALTVGESGKMYEFVRLDKYVWTQPHHSFLLTLSVKEIGGDMMDTDMDVDEEDVLTIRAMAFDETSCYQLLQWNFKI